MQRMLLILFLLASLFSVQACTPRQKTARATPADLIPFATSTRSPSLTPVTLVAAETPPPAGQPTPFAYTVQAGDTISSIALKFGVSIDDLQAANPEVSPNAMSAGQTLNIPSNPENTSGESTPTPASFTVQQIQCYPTADQGMWCFVLVHNDFSDLLENVSAQVTLMDMNNAILASETALLPLNILPPNTSLPLTVFFPPEIPSDVGPRVQVLTAIRLLPGDERYLPVTINNTLVQVNQDGGSARVNGQVLLPGQSRAASQVWVAATAYDDAGRVVGFRKWESGAGLSPGGVLPFEFMVASIGGKIAQVEFAVEARP